MVLALTAPISTSAQSKPKRDVTRDQTAINHAKKTSPKKQTPKHGSNAKSSLLKEQEAYAAASQEGTVKALKEFIRAFPNSKYYNEACNSIDTILWQEANKEDTEAAYSRYMQESLTKTHENEATLILHQKRAFSEWQRIRFSANADDFYRYMTEFPDSNFYKQAKYLYFTLLGDNALTKGNKEDAIALYSQANNISPLDSSRRSRLNQLKEESEYLKMKASYNISMVEAYYYNLPAGSPYKVEIGDHLAVLKAQRLYESSKSREIKECLNLAQTPHAKTAVKLYVRQSKGIRKPGQFPSWWRHRAMLGWEIGHFDYSPAAGYTMVGTGLNLRLGRYCDAFNFIVGAGYQTLLDMPNSVHQLYGSAKIRFNIGGLAAKSKFYLGGGAVYEHNLGERHNFNKFAINIKPELGISGTHYDWGLYAKRYIENYPMHDEPDWHFGTSITWYF